MKKLITIIITAVLSVATLVVAVNIGSLVLSGAPKTTVIKLRRGTTIDGLTDTLSRAVDERFAHRVERVMHLLNADISRRQGAYRIVKGESPLTVARHIRNGIECTVSFTFNNIRTREQWTRRVGKTFLINADSMMCLLRDPEVCAAYGKDTTTITTILLPDTYEFLWTVSPRKLLDGLYAEYKRLWDDNRINKAKRLGLSQNEVSILASIVEEETAKADDKPIVARLYYNRLKKGMPLQADPTVKFAIGDFSIRRISHNMLRTPSPYNTYLNKGLPPGPIRLPEKSTIDAVLDMPEHNFIYMCAREDFSGYHNFTASYAEHLDNARRYQAALNARNIRR